MLRHIAAHGLAAALILGSLGAAEPAEEPTYQELREAFASPDHAHWGEVPLWWWEGDRLTKERVTWELETLAAKGVKSVCPIQRSPGRCDPQSFSPAWWEMLEYVHEECQRLGMTLWAYDQVGYGHYGWLEKAAARTRDPRTRRVHFLTSDGSPGAPIRLELPEGEVLAARAYPMRSGVADDGGSVDIRSAVAGGVLQWRPPSGQWRAAVSVTVPHQAFHLSDTAADTFIDMLYGEIERRLGEEAMGRSFAGVFQDEHPPTPRDLYTERLAETFRRRSGYDIGRAIPALHFDVGPRTPRYRTDFFDAYLEVDEASYWERVYDWTNERGVLTSHDNWGRRDINRQSQGYIDYFRTQRWFSAPGNDDSRRHPLTERNYYDTKIAASIARLYGRPRVWSEAFHTSGWGRTTDETLSWLSADWAFGANLYDEHGLYYSTRASTWEHAAPDPHWRQPYWVYYQTLSDWVARMSHIMSQGTHVVDAAVHYPVVSLLAGEAPGEVAPDYNLYITLSRALYDAGIDNDIADDDSILAGEVKDGRIVMGGNAYGALVFGPEATVRRSVLRKARELAASGGTVLFFGRLPSASTEAGRGDAELAALLERILGVPPDAATSSQTITKNHSGGFAAFVPQGPEALPELVSAHVERDFVPGGGRVFVSHRRMGDVDVYLVQNTEEGPIDLDARFRVVGEPEIWDAFTGSVHPVDRFERDGDVTRVQHRLEGNVAELVVFRPGERERGQGPTAAVSQRTLIRTLDPDWTFSVIPTRDNRWGEFRWPPSDEVIGPEVRAFRFAEEEGRSGVELGWHEPDFDDGAWSLDRYSIGPYWLILGSLPEDVDVAAPILAAQNDVRAGGAVQIAGTDHTWDTVEFSKTIGLARPAPWGGHSGYPDGAIDQNFIELPEGRKLLFTRLRSPRAQRLGLRVELRNSGARLWVNGAEQPFEDAIGNLPLEEGANTVLLELPDGGTGMLYVQAEPPSVRSMQDAAAGMPKPDLRDAAWIRDAGDESGYLRKTFTLQSVPRQARIVVTAYTGFRLFVNGVKVEEEIGPWAKWTHPESFNITRYLHDGENVIAAWNQLFAGQNVKGETDKKGFVLAMRARFADGEDFGLVSDGSWVGTVKEEDGWEKPGFDDSGWPAVEVAGRMGADPWGTEPLENVGAVTEPRRSLAIDLPSPYLTCFDEVSDVVYDVKPRDAGRVGWYRFGAPPGLRELRLHTTAPAQVWVDGSPATVRDGVARLDEAVPGVSTVAIRLEMLDGEYGGAAFPRPLGLGMGRGRIQTGPWSEFALPTYSGLGVYEQTVRLTKEELTHRTELDLGQVLVAAEVLVNGRSAGVRLARPFKFDLSGLLVEGDNTIEVRVANTIAPHYTVTNEVNALGPTTSGLIGPVALRQYVPIRP
jgi:hypothetical protein